MIVFRRRLICAAVVIGAALSVHPFAARPRGATASGASAASTLPHLHGIDEVRDWFNGNKGHVRLILLLSPT